jgi:transposase InsO family protein
MSQRFEFVMLALQEGTNFSELCRRFDISRPTGYKFLFRYQERGFQGLCDLSKRPKHSPNITEEKAEHTILMLRDKHPAWGGRKLKRRLEDIGYKDIPSASTITQILKRNNRISTEESEKHQAWNRFEADGPNDLWQMDFKGYFQTQDGRCHPLTVLDDHSRYSLCIGACRNERRSVVTQHLIDVFRKYGLPIRMLMDNGPPWGSDSPTKFTRLTAWLMRLGIKISHSRPYHPQTAGKDERFHRTLKAEVLNYCENKSIDKCQIAFDGWRNIYNTERPHEALGMNTPVSRYRFSKRQYPEKIPDIEYGPNDKIRKVHDTGTVSYKNRIFRVGKAFTGQYVAIRPTNVDGKYSIHFCNQKIRHIDLTCNQ